MALGSHDRVWKMQVGVRDALDYTLVTKATPACTSRQPEE